jgi:hypothetical protein
VSGVSLLLIELLLSGVVIAFAVREVVVTRRQLREREAEERGDGAD